MVTFAQLRDAQTTKFERFGDGWHAVSNASSEAKDRIEQQIAPGMRGELKGTGATAAQERLTRLGKNFHLAQQQCGLIRTALNSFAEELRVAQRKLTTAISNAQDAGFTVGSDGTVSWENPVDGDAAARHAPDYDAWVRRKNEQAQGYADDFSAALKQADTADLEWSAKLGELLADNDLKVTDADWVDAREDRRAVAEAGGDVLPKGDIPKGKSPQENAEWWAGLSPDERADYVSMYPASVGALDGLPATVRDEANRMVLAETKAEYQTRLDAIPPEPKKPPSQRMDPAGWRKWKEWQERYGEEKQHLKSSLHGMEAIEDRFAKTGVDGLPEAYVLGFSAKDDGRAIIANGNPDTADHTAVYVPGTGSDLGGIGGNINRMTDLWAESDALDNGEVSTITWLGYDAPDGVVKDAPFSHYADDGAPAFSRFVDGLDASHAPGAESHTTAVGHSYGTTLIGSAARQGDLSADDVIFAGSPGVQVGHASDMDVPTGHVWNQEADAPGLMGDDYVPELGRQGHGHREPAVERGPMGIPYFNVDSIAPIVPSDERFEANQMSTDTEKHGGYWDVDKETGEASQSLKNQAAVVAGQYDLVQPD